LASIFIREEVKVPVDISPFPLCEYIIRRNDSRSARRC